MATREQVMNALLALLKATGSFVTISRRNRNPEGLAPSQSPALFLVEALEEYSRPSPTVQPKRALVVKAIFYNDVGPDENAIPSTPINNALDALDVALKPDDPATNRFTLGGLVFSAMIEGTIEKASGDVTGKSLAVVPIKIVLP